MATEALDRYQGVGYSVSSGFLERKWLLPREKLEKIAQLIGSVNPQFAFNYREVTEEQLSDLQEHCFKTVFEMCERRETDAIGNIQEMVRGLRDLSGNTIFHKFICDGKEAQEIEDIILQLNLANALSDELCRLALHQALKFGKSSKTLKVIMIQKYCTPLQLDHKGRRPIHIAVKKNRADAINSLRPMKDEKITLPMMSLSYHSNKKNMDLCPISLAVLKGHILCVDELIKGGMLPSVVRVGDEKMTLLHLAIYWNQFKMLRHLLTKYFNEMRYLIDVPNTQGYTPVILSAILGDASSLILLIDKGADLCIGDINGRTAVHHAVIGEQELILKILSKYGANLSAWGIETLCEQKKADGNESFSNFMSNLKTNKGRLERLELTHGIHEYILNPENLVFKGGGPKGIAYLGAIRVLEKRDIFRHIKRIAGVSAGAITAGLLAVGCTATEAEELLNTTPGTYFLDHPFTGKRIEHFIKDNLSIKLLKDAYDTISECVTNGSPIPVLKAVGLKLVNSVWRCTGLCEGELFLGWIETEITRKTGIRHCTFGELADLIVQGKVNPQGRQFKHLHVFATKMGQNPELAHFSSEDPTCKDLIISEAIRASMSIPLVFKSHILVFKKSKVSGEYEFHTQHSTYKSNRYDSLREVLRVDENKSEASYIDGGLIYNFPIDAFDKRKYIHNSSSEKGGDFSEFNRRTLGFSLHSPEDKTVFKERSSRNIGRYH